MALRVWLPLNGNLENKGISDYPITSLGTLSWVDGKISKNAMRAGDGTQIINGLKLDTNFIDLLNGDYSISVWIKPYGTHIHYNGSIFSSGNWNTANKRWSFGVSQDNSKVDVLCMNYNTYIACPIPENIWTNIICTRGSDNIVRLYKNGEYVGLRDCSSDPTFDSDYNYSCIGRESYANGYFSFNGAINDFRLYDHCLSAKEVKEISQGLVLHYKLDGLSGGNGDNILTGTATQTTVLASGTGMRANGTWSQASGGNGVHAVINIENDTPVPGVNWGFQITNNTSGNRDFAQRDQPYKNGVTYIVSWYMRGTGKYLVRQWNTTDGKQMQSKTGSVNTAEWTYYTWTFTATEELETDECTLHLGATGNTSLLEWCAIKMEIGSVATPWTPAPEDLGIDTTKIIDSSGYENNGFLINGTNEVIGINNSRYQICTNLLGTTVDSTSNTITGAQYLYTPLKMPVWNAITIAWWGNNIAYGRGGIFETTGTTGNIWEGSDYSTTAIANWDSTFGIFNGTTRINIFNNFVKDSTWHHHVITFDGINVKYYCDSILKQTSALTGTLPAITGFKMGLGRAGGVYRQIKQKLSDLRIYATALSAEDILDLYHTPANIDNLGGIHGFEFIEDTSARELLALPWTSAYSTHNKTSISTNYNDKHEWYSNTNSSAGSDYIKINPTGNTYYYDTEISVAAGNQFYIGFERYDENKTSRSNNACAYIVSIKPTSDIIHQRYFGTVNLATDGVNPTDTIALRILNAWSGTTSGSTKEGTIHYLSLREVSGKPQTGKIKQQGQIYTDEFVEREKQASIYENGFVGGNTIIEK